MRTFTSGFQTLLDGQLAALTRLVELRRRTKSTLYFCEGQENIVFGANTYVASLGVQASALQISGSLDEQTMDITVLLNAAGVTAEDLQNGEFDDQIAIVTIVDKTDPAVGSMILMNGFIGEAHSTDDGYAYLTIEGRMTRERYIAGESYSATCRNDLGDSVCSVNIEALADDFTVATITNQQNFTTTGLIAADDFFTDGLVKFTSGNNNNVVIECRKYTLSGGRIQLWLRPPRLLLTGDTGRIYPGCKKTLKVCINKFNNAKNFRGEPYLPDRSAVSLNGQIPKRDA